MSIDAYPYAVIDATGNDELQATIKAYNSLVELELDIPEALVVSLKIAGFDYDDELYGEEKINVDESNWLYLVRIHEISQLDLEIDDLGECYSIENLPAGTKYLAMIWS